MATQVPQHQARLPADYVERFGEVRVAEHLAVIDRLGDGHPVEVSFEDRGDVQPGKAACTVIAFDQPFEFSLIAGTLSGCGFNIEAGDVYTLPAERAAASAGAASPRKRRPRTGHNAPVIVDRFIGCRAAPQEPFDAWAARVNELLTQVITLLDKREPAFVTQAKQRVNELVTRRLATMPHKPAPLLLPVELELARLDSGLLRLTVTAQDTPAFLYALSTALSLRGLSIDRVRIVQDEATGMFTDTIDLVPRRGEEVDDGLLQRIKLSALLTKQFTYFLERSPDPYAALTRYERLTEDMLGAAEQDADRWFELLGNPTAMGDLARLLGASDYLWEDFIRGQAESLAPILQEQARGRALAEPIETLPQRIEQALAGAVGVAEQQDRLNRFKDREIYRLDLSHILNPAMDFRRFSENLTFLAENLVATATRLVLDDLVRSYGAPPARHAVFGLGKLGGVALGYASDIELLYVYDGDPNARTAGGKRKAVAVSQFFEQLAQEASSFIRTKREGIFAVDLRLRPFGTQGPLATSADAFARYYGGKDPSGGAHPFELLALVRLRWIAGHAELGYHVERTRDQIVYEGPDTWLDLDRLWDVWCRMKREKLTERGRLNAKYSTGALVDLEGAVELLQVRHARRAPQLRTPRISQAMEGLHRAGVLTANEYAAMRGAYDFFRKLINALRMLRGHARDLLLPPHDALELTHLARRMDYPAHDEPARRMLDEFERHTAQVSAFFEKHIGRPCPAPHHSIDTLPRA